MTKNEQIIRNTSIFVNTFLFSSPIPLLLSSYTLVLPFSSRLLSPTTSFLPPALCLVVVYFFLFLHYCFFFLFPLFPMNKENRSNGVRNPKSITCLYYHPFLFPVRPLQRVSSRNVGVSADAAMGEGKEGMGWRVRREGKMARCRDDWRSWDNVKGDEECMLEGREEYNKMKWS